MGVRVSEVVGVGRRQVVGVWVVVYVVVKEEGIYTHVRIIIAHVGVIRASGGTASTS